MEVIGGAAAVTGIVGFAGQAIDGILKLRNLLKDAAAAKDTVEKLLEDIDLLKSLLEEVERVVQVIENKPPEELHGMRALNTGVLKYQTKACVNDVLEWIRFAEKLDPRSEKGLRRFLRKIHVAANTGDLTNLSHKISSHQQRIGVSLSILGRSFDFLGNQHLENLNRKFHGLTEAHLQLNDQVNESQIEIDQSRSTTDGVVARLVSQLNLATLAAAEIHHGSQPSLQSIHDSISSLSSSISKLLAKLSPAPYTDTVATENCDQYSLQLHQSHFPTWGCDAISGIEDAFENTKCIYCNMCFAHMQSKPDWCARGRHLATVHSFGACNFATLYTSWADMESHLTSFHALNRTDLTESGLSSVFLLRPRSTPFFQRNKEDNFQATKHFEEQAGRSHVFSSQILAAVKEIEFSDVHIKLLMNCFLDYYSGGEQEFDISILPRLQEAISTGKLDKPLHHLYQIKQDLAYLAEEMVIEGKETGPSAPPTRFEARNLKLDLERVRRGLWGDNSSLERLVCALFRALEEREDSGIINSWSPDSNAELDWRVRGWQRINNWLLQILRLSHNMRIIIRKHSGYENTSIAEMSQWLSLVMNAWYIDGTAMDDGQVHLISDGAIDSRDNLIDEPALDFDGFIESPKDISWDEDFTRKAAIYPESASHSYTDSFKGSPVSSAGSGNSIQEVLSALRFPGTTKYSPAYSSYTANKGRLYKSDDHALEQSPPIKPIHTNLQPTPITSLHECYSRDVQPIPCQETDLKGLQIEKVLDSGPYDVVSLAKDVATGIQYIVKQFHKFTLNGVPVDRQQWILQQTEIRLHCQVSQHPNIAALLRIIDTPMHLYSVTDHFPEGDLFSNIVELGRYVGDDIAAKNIFLQILDAVSHCHNKGIYHQDLRPENIWVTQSSSQIKLANFHRATAETVSTNFGCGSKFYMAPECLDSSLGIPCYSCAPSDIWSLGVILVNLTCAKNPWQRASRGDPLFRAYLNDRNSIRSTLPISNELNEILKTIFELDATRRIKLPELRQRIIDCRRLTVPRFQ